MRTRRGRWTFGLAVLVITLGAALVLYPTGHDRVVEVAGVHVVIGGERPEGDEVGSDGTLTVLSGGCMGIRHRHGGEELLVWPAGLKTGDGRSPSVEVDGVTLWIGDEVSTGGTPIRDAEQSLGDLAGLPRKCLGYSAFRVTEVLAAE